MTTEPAVAAPTRGLSVYPNRHPRRLIELAHVAESVGYSHLWFGDSQNIWREVYTCMGAVAATTSRIVIGTGVTNGVTRHRSVVASGWASLSELTGGRVAAGFGVGDSALHTMGRKPMRVADLAQLVNDLRALWHAEDIKEPDGDAPYRLSYLGGPVQVPIYLAASGPKILELAGQIADGTILLVGTGSDAIATALDRLAIGAETAGRTLEDIHTVLWTPVAIDPDAGLARDRVRAHVARTVLRPISATLTASEQDAVDRIRAEYDYYAHMVPGSPHSQLVTDSLVDRFALAGTAEYCRTRLHGLGALGIDQVAMIPFPDPDRPAEVLLEEFADL
jgi:5,10-methylenetetrahydromethanopterin reductase